MTETEQTAYEQTPVGFFSPMHSSVAAPSEGKSKEKLDLTAVKAQKPPPETVRT